MLELIGLKDAGGAFPHELSGGQQQRVALARALAPNPDLLLLDEPFSSLDIDLRERLTLEVRGILKAAGTTAILVTHDQHEAFVLADEIGVMNEGAIEQWDSAYRLYHQPRTRFVADFVGQGVFLRGVAIGRGRVLTELGELASDNPLSMDEGAAVDLLLRPTTSCTTTRVPGRPRWPRRPSAAPTSSTRSRSPPARGCFRSCLRTTTTRLASASAFVCRSTT